MVPDKCKKGVYQLCISTKNVTLKCSKIKVAKIVECITRSSAVISRILRHQPNVIIKLTREKDDRADL